MPIVNRPVPALNSGWPSASALKELDRVSFAMDVRRLHLVQQEPRAGPQSSFAVAAPPSSASSKVQRFASVPVGVAGCVDTGSACFGVAGGLDGGSACVGEVERASSAFLPLGCLK